MMTKPILTIALLAALATVPTTQAEATARGALECDPGAVVEYVNCQVDEAEAFVDEAVDGGVDEAIYVVCAEWEIIFGQQPLFCRCPPTGPYDCVWLDVPVTAASSLAVADAAECDPGAIIDFVNCTVAEANAFIASLVNGGVDEAIYLACEEYYIVFGEYPMPCLCWQWTGNLVCPFDEAQDE